MNKLFLSALFAMCAGCVIETSPEPPLEAPAPFAEVTADGKILIEKSALGRPLALTRTYSIGASIDNTNPLRTMLVYFELDGETSVSMKEIQSGTETPAESDRTLATFPALISGNAVTFDFNEGMNKIHFELGVYEWWKEPKELVFDIVESSVNEIRTVEGAIVIDRDETASVPDAGEIQIAHKYGFAEYKPAEGFEPRQNNKVNSFYVNAPVQGGGASAGLSFAHRHDTSRPIIYHLPSDTPDERRADVEIAVKYWNAIFNSIGKTDLIKLDILPEDVGPLDPGRHVIAWFSDFELGAGRALNTTDPLTGRIMKSTVFVTSIFELQGEDAASTRWMMDQIDSGGVPSPLSDAALSRVVSDYYINTFAHEIGHGLGLRHNFAGNLGSNIDAKTYMGTFIDYLKSDLPADVAPTSSVMEYVETPLAVLLGAHIRLGREPLPFDVQAVQSMYGSGEAQLGLYCEQETAPFFADCVEFDQGSNTIVGTYWQWENTLDERAFVLAKAIAAGVPLSAPDVDPAIEALIIADPLKRLSRLLAADAEFLSVLAAFPETLTDAQYTEYRSAVLDHQKQGFSALDGPRVQYVKDLVSTGIDAQKTADLSSALRTRMEGYLMAVGGSVDPATADAFFAALAVALEAEVTPLNQIMYACFSC